MPHKIKPFKITESSATHKDCRTETVPLQRQLNKSRAAKWQEHCPGSAQLLKQSSRSSSSGELRLGGIKKEQEPPGDWMDGNHTGRPQVKMPPLFFVAVGWLVCFGGGILFACLFWCRVLFVFFFKNHTLSRF